MLKQATILRQGYGWQASGVLSRSVAGMLYRFRSQIGFKRLGILLLCFCTSCATTTIKTMEAQDRYAPLLFSGKTAIQDAWQHFPLHGETGYTLAAIDGRVAIRAVGRNSASGLIREVQVEIEDCSEIEWSWRVDQIQADADIRVKEHDDVAASIFLLFGDPGPIFNPHPVPTLRYVWTNNRVDPEAIVDSPYMPDIVKNVVVRTGRRQAGTWVTEWRNFVQDFEKAFGHPIKEPLRALVLFTDNDQTQQPVTAYYELARLRCPQTSNFN